MGLITIFTFVKGCLRRRVVERSQRPTPRPTLEQLEDRTVPSTITHLSPAFGPAAGGGMVQISGSGFTGASLVSVGASAAAYMVISDTVIQAQAPAHAAGVVDIVVTAPSGVSPTSAADQYTYGAAATSSSLYSSANPSTSGQAVTFYAMVSSGGPGSPTGAVTFKDGATVIGTANVSGGMAAFTTSALAAGGHTITAVYGGDANFAGSTSAALTQSVQLANTTITLSSDVNPSGQGNAVIFTAEVDSTSGGAPTGTVTFMKGQVSLGTATLAPGGGGSQATLSTSTLLLGSNSITAVYSGDTNYNGSTSAALTQTVVQAALDVWTGAVSSDWNNAANWSVGGRTATVAPSQSDSVLFSGAMGSDVNCSTSGVVFVGALTIDASYSGTLTLNSQLDVMGGGLDVEGGAIAQPNGTPIYVLGGVFTWGAGNINAAGTAAATLYLVAADTPQKISSIQGNNDCSTGDTIAMLNTKMSFNIGQHTLTLTNAAGMSLDTNSEFDWNAAGSRLGAQALGGIITNSGTFQTTFTSGTAVCDLPMVMPVGASKAYLGVAGGGVLEFTTAALNVGYSVLNNAGTVDLGAAATLKVDGKYRQNGGHLYTEGARAEIGGGDVKIHGGNINLARSLARAGLLFIDNNLDMDGGTFLCNVDATRLLCDDIEVEGNASFGSGSVITTLAFLEPAGGFPANKRFNAVDVHGALSGNFATTNLSFQDGTNGMFTENVDTNTKVIYLDS